nr:immunoglobulin heavy chain junction region [Macaca mulatta]MOW91511.1 immunoglobulin heavy chain junction region [Macaca mulatta]
CARDLFGSGWSKSGGLDSW